MIWGRQVAGLPGRRVAYKGWSRQVAGSPGRIQRLSKVACSASPQVAGSPSQIFQYNANLHINAKVHDLGSPGRWVAGLLGRRVAESPSRIQRLNLLTFVTH